MVFSAGGGWVELVDLQLRVYPYDRRFSACPSNALRSVVGLSPRWDTPTDGISRKVFDRYKDASVRRYVGLSTVVRDLAVRVARLERRMTRLWALHDGETEEE